MKRRLFKSVVAVGPEATENTAPEDDVDFSTRLEAAAGQVRAMVWQKNL
jgi:hypothetical protein